MEIRGMTLSWDQKWPLGEVLEEAHRQQFDYLIFTASTDATMASNLAPAADLMVVRDPFETELWNEFSRNLPPQFYFVAVPPSEHLAVAISLPAITATLRDIQQPLSTNELIARSSAVSSVSFFDDIKFESTSRFRFPGLTMADEAAIPPEKWRGQMVPLISLSGFPASTTACTALKAGLFLLSGFFEESHTCSQSIEGMSPHTGDYWHAILHRREPDYGNSKYWFRHVGQYPTFVELAEFVSRKFDDAANSLSSKLDRWKPRLIARGKWDPFAFVDLCAAAEDDPGLKTWCEEIQYTEMRLLLVTTAQAVHAR